MFDIMNDLSELIYVADIHTHDLLFINTAGKLKFKIDDISGKKCYQALQNRTSPCPFCNNALLKKDEIHSWEYTNPITKNHYLLKDRPILWEGREARMEIAFDITEKEHQRIELENALEAEKVVMKCVRMIYDSKNLSQTIQDVLSDIGTFLMADRAYIFEIRGAEMYNTYEWCARHVTAEKDNLQGLDVHFIDSWLPHFSEHGCYIVEELDNVREVLSEGYTILAQQGIHSMVTAPLERDGVLVGYIGVDNPPSEKIRNISSLFQTLRYFLMSAIRIEENEKVLTHLSYHDTLTGAFNRNRYTHDVMLFSQHTYPIGVVFLDINGLKEINDKKGHQYGDSLLKECVRRINEVFEREYLYRVGGDEFIILCPEIKEAAFLELVKRLKERFLPHNECSAAIGYQWNTNAHHLQDSTSAADAMMYREKRAHYQQTKFSGRYRGFNEDVYGLTDPGILQKLLSQNRFQVFLQPKSSFSTQKLVGVEALVRYCTANGDIIEPKSFLSTLESAGLISLIDFHVFEFACIKINQWLHEGMAVVPISINFSPITFREPRFSDKIAEIAGRFCIAPHLLEIELLDDSKFLGYSTWRNRIEDVRSHGFTVSLDDFGAEHTNFSALLSIDYDRLKIDPSIVRNINNSSKAASILQYIVKICKEANVKTTVTGVETAEQYCLLQKMGFEELQGYFFSPPLPVEMFELKYLSADEDNCCL